MSKKGSRTTADYLDFDKTLNQSLKILQKEKKFKIAFLIVVGINSGLRIGDILSLKYGDFKNDVLEIQEQKTKKIRRITLNQHILNAYQVFIKRIAETTPRIIQDQNYVFVSQMGSVFSIRQVNRELKKILADKKSRLNISTHTLRKIFGRKIYSMHDHGSLAILSELFNHSSEAISRKYLGLRQEEIQDIYLSL